MPAAEGNREARNSMAGETQMHHRDARPQRGWLTSDGALAARGTKPMLDVTAVAAASKGCICVSQFIDDTQEQA
ncbi:MAG TPA: hypothetical protein VFA19_04420 [Gaiellaceae bacterium]|nr:hypothetical protein [Gaiellaceae bacterium]